jgi:hypothetical protein
MPTHVDFAGVAGWEDICFIYMTGDDLEAGQTLEEIVNPPKKNVQVHEDGSTTWTQECVPFNWRYKDESKTTLIRESPLVQVLIMTMSFIKIGRITEENWQETWARIHIYEQVFGKFFAEYVHPGEVQELVGIHFLNVITEPMDAFLADVGKWLDRETKTKLKKILKDEEKD